MARAYVCMKISEHPLPAGIYFTHTVAIVTKMAAKIGFK